MKYHMNTRKGIEFNDENFVTFFSTRDESCNAIWTIVVQAVSFDLPSNREVNAVEEKEFSPISTSRRPFAGLLRCIFVFHYSLLPCNVKHIYTPLCPAVGWKTICQFVQELLFVFKLQILYTHFPAAYSHSIAAGRGQPAASCAM